jgi:S-adenosylmethionine-dependent methyltransferase
MITHAAALRSEGVAKLPGQFRTALVADRKAMMRSDTNFDGNAVAFEEGIYGTSKGHVRLEVLWEDLIAEIPQLAHGGLFVLDAGGGTGHIALRLAQLGNRVVLCDSSREMLDRAEDAVRQARLSDLVVLEHAPIQELNRVVAGQFDLIVCHAVLEWLADPKAVLSQLASCLRPKGQLSLLFYNRNAALFRRVFRGEFADALRELKEGCGPRGWKNGCVPLAEETVRQWLEEFGFSVRAKSGIRIFHDHLPETTRSRERLGDLLDIERSFRKQEPFASLGHHLHLVCERDR